MNKIILLLIFLIPFSAMAGIKIEKDLRPLTIKVMDQIDKGNFDKAVDLLRPHWSIPMHEIDGLAYKLKQEMPMVMERFGNRSGYIAACEQNISTVGKRISYLQKFENHALVWIFIFYKPKDEWQLNSVIYNDRWHELFGVACSNE